MAQPIVVDMKGVPLKKGQTVLVYQEEGFRSGTVIDTFEDEPVATTNEKGHWVDVEIEDPIKGKEGVEGIMSYILEVSPLNHQ